MLTYNLKKEKGRPLYEELYLCIKSDIQSGRIREGEKLPSKRALAEHLKIGKVTVENAYAQLSAEGYIRSEQRRGYFAEAAAMSPYTKTNPEYSSRKAPTPLKTVETPYTVADLAGNNADTGLFPFSVWIRLVREVVLDFEKELLRPLPHNGAPELREAICSYLYRYRGIDISPEQVLIGAGTEYLYGLLPQLLGRNMVFATENPGYSKARLTYSSMGAETVGVALDSSGVIPQNLYSLGADILHISPSHHFPTGTVTPVKRRKELYEWACEKEGRYIVEDDYDCEFRMSGKPIPPMLSTDTAGRVIYINTFSKSISPSLRISYMILPDELCDRYRQKLGFYSCTVPSFEQYTLARFIERGYFEKHISRLRKYYRDRRDKVISVVKESPAAESFQISEENAGLHFILKIDTSLSDSEFCARAEQMGVRIKSLSNYYENAGNDDTHEFIFNYSGATEAEAGAALKVFEEILKGECNEKMSAN